jgi:hypothetical protein
MSFAEIKRRVKPARRDEMTAAYAAAITAATYTVAVDCSAGELVIPGSRVRADPASPPAGRRREPLEEN